MCKQQQDALNDIRYASDVLRDYVLASDRKDLQKDLVYHWQCMDAAQNAVLPALASGLTLVITFVATAWSMWTAGLAAMALTASVVWLLHRSFCDHSRYLTDAIFRSFHIAWAMRSRDDR